jgi:NADPH:quinone reductase-like Zn-dependent oxidoreductase
MKAVVYTKYGHPEVLRIKEAAKPVPRDNEVLIKIYSTTVTAVDSIFRQGNQFFARLATGVTKPKNQILGAEFSGEVETAGKDVKLFKPGDYIFGACEGTHCEYICLPEDAAIVEKPSNMNFNEAAAVPYGTLTALPFLRDSGKIKSDKKVLIIGASGSVGSYAVQLAKYFGAEATGVCSTSNLEMVKSIGADKTIDYTKENFTSSGEKYDIIFDAVGRSSFSSCKNSLTRNGIFLTAAISTAILFQMLWTSKLSSKKAQITFTGLRSAGDKAKDLVLIKELIESGKIKAIIDKIFPLEQIAEAHHYVDQGHKKGNIVITIDHNNKS